MKRATSGTQISRTAIVASRSLMRLREPDSTRRRPGRAAASRRLDPPGLANARSMRSGNLQTWLPKPAAHAMAAKYCQVFFELAGALTAGPGHSDAGQ